MEKGCFWGAAARIAFCDDERMTSPGVLNTAPNIPARNPPVRFWSCQTGCQLTIFMRKDLLIGDRLAERGACAQSRIGSGAQCRSHLRPVSVSICCCWGGSGGSNTGPNGPETTLEPIGIAHRASECLSYHSERGNTVTYSLGITARDFSEKS